LIGPDASTTNGSFSFAPTLAVAGGTPSIAIVSGTASGRTSSGMSSTMRPRVTSCGVGLLAIDVAQPATRRVLVPPSTTVPTTRSGPCDGAALSVASSTSAVWDMPGGIVTGRQETPAGSPSMATSTALSKPSFRNNCTVSGNRPPRRSLGMPGADSPSSLRSPV
jgi:hypothetical protein